MLRASARYGHSVPAVRAEQTAHAQAERVAAAYVSGSGTGLAPARAVASCVERGVLCSAAVGARAVRYGNRKNGACEIVTISL